MTLSVPSLAVLATVLMYAGYAGSRLLPWARLERLRARNARLVREMRRLTAWQPTTHRKTRWTLTENGWPVPVSPRATDLIAHPDLPAQFGTRPEHARLMAYVNRAAIRPAAPPRLAIEGPAPWAIDTPTRVRPLRWVLDGADRLASARCFDRTCAWLGRRERHHWHDHNTGNHRAVPGPLHLPAWHGLVDEFDIHVYRMIEGASL